MRVPVHLLVWIPPTTAGEYDRSGVHATPRSYGVSLDFTNSPTPVNGRGMTSMAGTLGLVHGGPPGLGARRDTNRGCGPGGPGRPIRLPDGRTANALREAGYPLERLISAPVTAAAVMPFVRKIIAAVGPAGNPVGPHTTEQLFQDIAPDRAAMTLWRQGGEPYEVWGYAATAIRLAQSPVVP